MMVSQTKLENTLSKIREPLAYFEAINELGPRLGLPVSTDVAGARASPRAAVGADDDPGVEAADPGSEEFFVLLRRLDECIEFVSARPHFRDSSVYLVKFRQVQLRALSLLKNYVVELIKDAANETRAALAPVGGPPSDASGAAEGAAGTADATAGVERDEGAETAALYVRFRTQLADVGRVVAEIGRRSMIPEYAELVAECHARYLEARLSLLHGIVMRRMDELSHGRDVRSTARLSGSYVVRVCVAEYQLFHHIFAVSSVDGDGSDEREAGSSGDDALREMLEDLCGAMGDVIRPAVLQEHSLDILCELTQIWRHEVLEEQVRPRRASAAAVETVAQTLIQDAQERLIYRMQTYTRDEIAGFKPTAAQLDYPTLLIEAASGAGEPTDGEAGRRHWYPVLDRTLSSLAKVYHCVPGPSFETLAQEAVSSCTASLLSAARTISKTATPLDSDLFLVKHLLILREQISPFDIEFSVTEKRLDFRNTAQAFYAFLARYTSIFQLSRDNPLLSLFAGGLPTIEESQVDSKRDLEHELKSACERFIRAATGMLVQPLVTFSEEVAAFRAAHGEGEHLSTQPFATPSVVTKLLEEIRGMLQSGLPVVLEKIALYLENPVTRSILFKPVKTHILDGFRALELNLETYEPRHRDDLALTVHALRTVVERAEDNRSPAHAAIAEVIEVIAEVEDAEKGAAADDSEQGAAAVSVVEAGAAEGTTDE